MNCTLAKICIFGVFFFISCLSAYGNENSWTTDALFDMARQTESLQDAYTVRLTLPSSIEFFDLHVGIDILQFKDYPVLTEYGATECSILINYSYFRLEIPGKKGFDAPLFRLRGIDFSGKSVALGNSFVVDGVGFSELQGRIALNDMALALLSVWVFDLDFGIIRSRRYADYIEAGLTKSDGSKGVWTFFMPHETDAYSFVFSLGSGKLFDINMRFNDALESINPKISIPTALAMTGIATVPSWLRVADIWVDSTQESFLAGAAFEVGLFQTKEIEVTPSKGNTQKDYRSSGWRTGIFSEYNPKEVCFDNARIDGELRLNNIFITSGVSYTQDARLIQFGSQNGRDIGFLLGGGYTFADTVTLSVTVSRNYTEYLSFMSGSYNHTLVVASFAWRM